MDIKDAAKFSSFAQRVKMAYWNSSPQGSASKVPEIYLNEILLICWEDFKKFPRKEKHGNI